MPKLGALFTSPPYDAVLVISDPEVGVNWTEHDPEEREHGLGENVPDPPVCHETLPVGEKPVSVAMHVVDAPTTTVEGEQLTEVVVAALETVSEVVPELGALLGSPE